MSPDRHRRDVALGGSTTEGLEDAYDDGSLVLPCEASVARHALPSLPPIA